jgi:HSP20 family protein
MSPASFSDRPISMNDIRTLHLKLLQHRLGEIACELTQVRFRTLGAQPPWQPRINIYRCRDRIMICVELAGIAREEIELRVEPLRVWLGGRRRPPTPNDNHGELLQILALEIDDGRCEREIPLPEEIVPEEVRAEQHNGMLWIDLPLLARG